MAYNILGICPGHNSATALVSDGKLIFYLEEERLSRIKRDGSPFRSMIYILEKYKIDELILGGTMDPSEENLTPFTMENSFHSLVRKYNPNVKFTLLNHQHHLLHASSAFYNSKFDRAACLVIDGAGSKRFIKFNDVEVTGWEAESIWEMGKDHPPSLLYKSIGTNHPARCTDDVEYWNEKVTIVKTYEAVTSYFSWHPIEAGKTMGLAPYGKNNPNIPSLFNNGRANSDLFFPNFAVNSFLDQTNNPQFQRSIDPKEWHRDFTKISEIEKDLAWQIQNDTQEEVAKLIEKTIDLTGLNKICIAGGYGLNCVANYYLKKRFPNIEIYHEPASHDGGTAIGAAYLGWYEYSKQAPEPSISTIYYGPKYNPNDYINTIKNYDNKFNKYKITPKQVAKLISENNIVTIFQGRSEAGPRALGNRSILYNPTDPNGKDFVNKVKNREWFRPFAGTVLLEKANEWFDMAGLEESPFMMYAMDVWPDKQETIKAITHVDGTCRIQTVTEEQNPHYYKLIQEFEKITGVPILFNTSFNLAGDPLVETIKDALETLLKSEIKYLYLPECETILTKK